MLAVVVLAASAVAVALAVAATRDGGATALPAPIDAPSSADASGPDAPPLQPETDAADPAAADGVVPDGTDIFADVPALANLDPALLDALRRAASDAAGDGVVFELNSGWRSGAYQERLLADAVAEYGSAAEAARWVATAETSPHVRGEAVDLGTAASAWLAEHGADSGLCSVYANEPWHFELRPDAARTGCPVPYADPTADPRMRG
ncbi:peptidase M15 [Agromyces sp. MMS17-SY077]|uniref:Peptidase M15 n=2 Tax=Agromyces seonyuensis TaxID=2662446 RepID=A0A6I4P0J3_9MICO|nr:peptidase M15 [Agromyces seonyuensis]